MPRPLRLPSRQAATAIFAALGLALLVAGCGGMPSSAGVSSNLGGATSTPSVNSEFLAFSQCMRSHRVPGFPDPNNSGKPPNETALQLGVSPSQFQAAQDACAHLLPNGGSGPTSSEVQQYRNYMLKYSRCMRTHGISDFPDPDSRGHIDVGPGSGVDINSPSFQAAFQVCQPNPNWHPHS